jgi:hypothetical protein
VPSDGLLGLAKEVAAGVRFPPLILVTTGLRGDLVVLEGHTRLTGFMLARDHLPWELEVLVGSSATMTCWGVGSRSVVAEATMSRFMAVANCSPVGGPSPRPSR